ncbi:MAG: fructose-bisphosphate aldolase class I [Actinomycetota bacterium]|nr:fructose-bisphosphate aldolase class I [Actinomycetota bacterium]
MDELRRAAADLVARPRGILAADESPATMDKRLEGQGITASEDSRRAYREMLVTTPGLSDSVSGVILSEETFNQRLSDGRLFPEALAEMGLATGVKVDTGAKPLAGAPGETVTEGLDGLRDRLRDFASRGAVFAKWRAVITIGQGLPTQPALRANAHALARYAMLCQEQGIVPIVEPEVVAAGDHTMDQCEAVSSFALLEVFAELAYAELDLPSMVLKPNMITPGLDRLDEAAVADVAESTVAALRRIVAPEVAGIAFLSGGQPADVATQHLAGIAARPAPWPLTFSFGRALVDQALHDWGGRVEGIGAGQAALSERVRETSAALRGSVNALR